jgi:hypothetical protein
MRAGSAIYLWGMMIRISGDSFFRTGYLLADSSEDLIKKPDARGDIVIVRKKQDGNKSNVFRKA